MSTLAEKEVELRSLLVGGIAWGNICGGEEGGDLQGQEEGQAWNEICQGGR